MRAVKVQYKVRPEFSESNKANVGAVMDKLRAEPIEGMKYATFVLDDGQTFIHLNFCKDQETMSKLQELPEFKAFRQALKESSPIEAPKSENLDLVAAGYSII